jgi:cytochrome b561
VSSRTLGRAAVFCGVLAIIAVPAAIAAAQQLSQVSLLQALYVATPISIGLGLLALLLVRRARLAAARSVKGERAPRLGRVAAWAGLYVGVASAIALGVYGVLTSAQ